MKKITKIFTFLILMLTINSACFPAVVTFANEIQEDKRYEAVKNSNTSVTLIDIEKRESVTIDILDNNNAIYTDVDGNKNEVYIDGEGNVYLNGVLEATRDDVNVRVVREEEYTPNSSTFRMSRSAGENLQYTYLDTLYYDTKTQGDIQGLALSLLSFVPYVGPVFAITGIFNSFQSLGHPVMYVKIHRFYAKGYQFYRYDSYFYSDPARKNLVTRRTEYKQMWYSSLVSV